MGVPASGCCRNIQAFDTVSVSARQMSVIINSWKKARDTHNSMRLPTILHQSSSLNLIVDNKIHDTLKLKAHVGCLWTSMYIYVSI